MPAINYYMFNFLKLHYIHTYIHTHTHTHTHLTSHHCMHEASVLILLVMYYMATHTQIHSKTHIIIHTSTHQDHFPHQNCCPRGRSLMVDLPPYQRGRGTRRGGARGGGADKRRH